MKKVKRFLKTLILLVFCYSCITFITPFSKRLKQRSIEHQINYLMEQNTAGTKLQMEYPEGYVFYNALLALSIIEYSETQVSHPKEYSKFADELIGKLISDEGRLPFPTNQTLEYGAFYNGWTNFTLKKYLASPLFEFSEFKPTFIEKHQSISDSIIQVQSNEIRILDSYPGAYWPADNLICAISLPDENSTLTTKWINALKSNSKNVLMNHNSVNLNKVRGSSQSLIVYLLSQYDKELASKDHSIFKRYFIDNFLGIQFVHEDLDNPTFSDIDSGPIILGYGSVSTIVNCKAIKGIDKRSRITEGFLNLLGVPVNLGGNKYYLFKQEPMFDVFMLWVQVD